MLKKRIIYSQLFFFFIWLALATRYNAEWFLPIIAKYGGDVIWAGAFLFLLRVFFINIAMWKLAVLCYILGVLDEFSQLIHTEFTDALRSGIIGRLMFGQGFMWSDIVCYAVGILLAWGLIVFMERSLFATKKVIKLLNNLLVCFHYVYLQCPFCQYQPFLVFSQCPGVHARPPLGATQ